VSWMVCFLSSLTAFKMRSDSVVTFVWMGRFMLLRIFFDLKSTTPESVAWSWR